MRVGMGSRLLERVSQAWPRGGGRSGHKSQNVVFSKYDAMVWTMKVTRVQCGGSGNINIIMHCAECLLQTPQEEDHGEKKQSRDKEVREAFNPSKLIC